MGNSISAEAPWKGHRASQKLSKPKIGNPTAAGLLNTNGASNPPRHSPAARRASLPHAPIFSAPPMLPEKDPIVSVSVPGGEKGLDLGRRISRRLFRSNTSKDVPRHHRRSNSVEVPDLPQERWSNRIESLGNGFDEGYNYGQASAQVSLSMSASRTSFNYDHFSYEAQRLSNLVNEPSREDNSTVLESRIHISEAMRGDLRGRRPSIPEAPPSITHNNSDLSLYTPMRRRSFMTPGVATREMPIDSNPPKTRYSVPSTPARRESIESMGISTINAPHRLTDPEPVPRALTPCEAEYTQTGAFKLGTLRITNGSPARSPARSPVRDVDRDTKYEDTVRLAVNGTAEAYSGTVQTAPTNHIQTQSSEVSVSKVEVQINSNVEGAASTYSISSRKLPELPGEHQASPPVLDDEKLTIPDIHVTSKHTAIEDKLFDDDDDQDEYSSVEVLDVRLDANAKSTPPCKKPTAEERSSKEISRSDSGIASPASEYSAAPFLSKADSGYSSSVSLRSFSSKPQAPEQGRTAEVMNDASVKQSRRAEELEATSPTITTANVDTSKSSDERSPPPVPMKDPHFVALASPKTPGELSPQFQQAPRSLGAPQPTQVPERVLPPRNMWNHPSRNMETYKASLRSPPTSSPSRSITTGFRKPGKLQRFLSGSRVPLTAHNTHPVGYARVPAVSRDMHARLQMHSGSRPISFRKLALRSAASKETLGTILSVGSAELLQDEDLSPKILGGQIMAPDRNQGTPVSIESTVTDNSSMLSKKSVRRKPVPARGYGTSRKPPTITKTSPESKLVQVASPKTTNGDPNDSTNIITSNDRTRYPTYIPRQPSSSTVVGHIEEGSRMINMRRSYEFAQGESDSATSLELPPPPMPSSRFSKSPPPVSMRTRNMGSLRVPSPVRSKSTPPENIGRPGQPLYSRRGSREGNLRTPDMSGTFAANQTALSRRSSRENFQNYTPGQARRYVDKSSALPAPNGVKPISFRSEAVDRAPSWDIQVDHGPSLSRQSSFDYSRRSSLASQSSRRSVATTGPALFRQPYHSQPDLPLHRRPSYDEYNIVPQDSCARDNGPYPSLSRNGQTYVSDPWSGRSMSLPRQWDEHIQHPTHAPRHHTRHQSLDQQGNPMHYRVLHSYNSPAYRHLPIWR